MPNNRRRIGVINGQSGRGRCNEVVVGRCREGRNAVVVEQSFTLTVMV